MTITGSSQYEDPSNPGVTRIEIKYDGAFRPLGLTLEGKRNGEFVGFRTSITAAGAETEITTDQGVTRRTDPIAADAVLLPNSFFGSYEAIAARLSTLEPGAELRVYVVPQAEVRLTLNSVSVERIQIGSSGFLVRRHLVTVQNAPTPFDAEIWSDERQHLLRVSVPVAQLEVIREDIATVAARHQQFWREGDEDVRIPASGFTIAATLSPPAPAQQPAAATKIPAIILVPGSDTLDRDGTLAGIPIMGQLAAALADAGFLVVRYDRRGVGQSGGRAESATLADYADDVRAIVMYLNKRKDVDAKRISVVGHGDGTFVALFAASREKRISALVLMASASVSGADFVLEQQQIVLDRLSLSAEERQARIDLQQRINRAVLRGEAWGDVPEDVRAQADTPWFRSLLAFDPVATLKKTRQPLLIVHGELDTQVPIRHADELASVAGQRKKVPPAEVLRLARVNHLFTLASSGEVSEYGNLLDKKITGELPQAIHGWLTKTLPEGTK